jgi:threonine dehydrogenase-like Zn-dependent dehydrogenase
MTDTSARLFSSRPIVRGRREIEWGERPVAAAVPAGSVRVVTEQTLISSGTEMRLYRGEPMSEQVWLAFGELDRSTRGREDSGQPAVSSSRAPAGPHYPVGIGYNSVGRVVACGAAVERLTVGSRVFTIARHESLIDVEEWEAVSIPPSVGNDDAVFAYCATLGLHALRRGQWQPGEPLAIVGLGLIGMAAALTADAFGAELLLIETLEARRSLAEKLLPNATIADPADVAHLRREVDLVIEAAGSLPALECAVGLVGRQGRVVVLALHPENVGSLLGGYFYEKEISIVATGGDPYYVPPGTAGHSTPKNIATIVAMVAAGRLSLAGIATHRFEAAAISSAFHDLDMQKDGAMVGVLLDWRSGRPLAAEKGEMRYSGSSSGAERS